MNPPTTGTSQPERTRARALVEQLRAAGITLVSSLSDTWLTPLLEAIDREAAIEHVRVAREDDGLGVCAGAFLAGRPAALVCQTAGLLLSVNALSAFAQHHQIPALVLAAHRGGHDDRFYYQAYKARVVEGVLGAAGVPFHRFDERSPLSLVGEAATQAYVHRRPVVLLANRRGLLGPPEGA